jgi:hypothetical protein
MKVVFAIRVFPVHWSQHQDASVRQTNYKIVVVAIDVRGATTILVGKKRQSPSPKRKLGSEMVHHPGIRIHFFDLLY